MNTGVLASVGFAWPTFGWSFTFDLSVSLSLLSTAIVSPSKIPIYAPVCAGGAGAMWARPRLDFVPCSLQDGRSLPLPGWDHLGTRERGQSSRGYRWGRTAILGEIYSFCWLFSRCPFLSAVVQIYPLGMVCNGNLYLLGVALKVVYCHGKCCVALSKLLTSLCFSSLIC